MGIETISTAYKLPNGKKGKALASTIGAAIDLESEDLRRFFVNACFWGTGIEDKTPEKADVSFISGYKGTMFGNDHFIRNMRPADFQVK